MNVMRILRRCSRMILAVHFVLAAPVVAQVDSALGFFPLFNGDFHQYHHQYSYAPGCPGGYSSYDAEQVFGDTLLPTGFRYRRVVSNVLGDPPLRYLRIDSATANVYIYVPTPTPHESLSDSLRASPGSRFIRYTGFRTECRGVDTITIFGIHTTVKRFHSSFVYGADYTLVYGFGRVQYVSYFDDPCYPVLDAEVEALVYARINGQEFGTFVGVRETKGERPARFGLDQNYPNPFNPTTTIRFTLPVPARVELAVFNILGQEIARLISGDLPAGTREVRWNAAGQPGGVYFCRLVSTGIVETRKLVLLP